MFFEYKKNQLFCENVSCKELAEKFGSPLYIYSANHFIESFKNLDKSLKGIKHIISYSIKSCSNISIVKLLIDAGAGADIVSKGELFRALKAGCKTSKIVYAGVGKSKEEIKFAIKNKILMFNVESFEEAELINQTAAEMNVKVDIALRINPDVDAKTHKHITTGKKENKFGINFYEVFDMAEKINTEFNNLKLTGVHLHIGSQITQITPFKNALKKLKIILDRMKERKICIKYINLGGGLGIKYNKERTVDPAAYGKILSDFVLKYDKNLTLIIEPGRSISGNAGILLTKVLYNKKSGTKNFIIIDAAMNDLIRPSFYEAYHDILPVEINGNKKIKSDIVGPVCESGDFFAKDRMIQKSDSNEYLAVMSAGAYGFTMASNYNSRLKPAEILVKNSDYFLIRKRDSYNDLIKNEILI
jgi:diaminopimelate decarboxylase